MADDPGGSVGPRLPTYMDPTNKFGELTFLQLTGKDGVSLPKNPFIIGKSVESFVGGPIESAKSEDQGKKYLLKIRNPAQVAKLLTLTKLFDGTEVEVAPHPHLNVSRCVISCYDIIEMDEKDILTEMLKESVVRVQRITRKEGEKRVNTPALILTFSKTTYPEYLKIGLLRIPTRPYFPNPMLCYNCFSYGHTRVRCPGPQRCFNCSGDYHGEEECNEASQCRNCKGDHRPTSRQCPVYKKEVEVIKIKVRDNVSFPEARKRTELQTGGSYAQAASRFSEFEKRLRELEATVKAKDEDIAKLREEIKQKDEKINSVNNPNQLLKQKISDERSRSASRGSQHHNQRPVPAQTWSNPVTRSSSHSPAVQEPKRGPGRPRKYDKSVISPDPSPPPKKTAVTTPDPMMMDCVSYEVEIPATPPSHTNTDNEIYRFGSGESVVPPPTQVQQVEGVVRDVLPQPVDDEFTSAADHTTETSTIPESWDRRQGEGIALLCPGRRPTQPTINPLIETNSRETSESTKSLSPVPAVAGNSGSNRVVMLATAGTVGQSVPQVSIPILNIQTDTAAPVVSGDNTNVPVLSPGEGPSRSRTTYIIQSASPVPAVVGIGKSSVMVSTAAGTVGQSVSQASLSTNRLPAAVTAASPSFSADSSAGRSTISSGTNSSSGSCFALQWNLRGLRANISELKLLIANLEPYVIALQETKVNQTVIPPNFVGRNYTLLLESNSTHYWQHGVGLAIREGIPFERQQINTSLHLVAARIYAPVQVTVVSIYIPPSSAQYQTALSELLDKLDGPVIFLGDFNAHHLAWGSSSSNALGRFIANTTLDRNLVILNSGSPTRIDPATGHTSAIDVTFCSKSLAPKFTWRTLSDTHNSDHFPITVTIPGWSSTRTVRRKWLYDRADWSLYEQITAETICPDIEWNVDSFTEKLIAAANTSIPRTSGRVGPKAVPWWCPEAKTAIRQRRKCLRALRRLQRFDPDQPAALASFQEARAAARKAIKEAKEHSWENFVATISPDSSTTKLWQTVNCLRGSRQQRTIVVKGADGFIDNPEEAAEELASHYSERSATSSYPPSFQMAKARAERESIDFSPNTEDVYNTDITLNELLWALDKGRGASTGPDMIGYPLLQRLPLSVKVTLLELLNKIWSNGEFPASWRNAIVVPIPKPNCHDTGPAAFRPISLTSCMAKLLERIINRRLITELELNGRLDKRQHAFRPGRGTDTYFAELEKSLPTADEHCLIASLDLSKAYDTTWRHGIVRTLKKWRIRGRMLNIIQSFLSERTFQVSVGRHLSREHPLENGVPQGSVLSVTLFLVAMQPIFQVIPKGVDILLYADDILLAVRGARSDGLYRKLQAAVKAADHWTKSVGFAMSATKSFIFYCSPNIRNEPTGDITIDQTPIPTTNQLRILGVTLDRTLTFRPHCKLTKKACEARLRILRMIGAQHSRGNRTSLLQVGSALVTSKLLYGIGLVSRGGSPNLQTLAPAYNKMVRFASGAFVTSPIVSIMAEAGTLPFELLAAQATVQTAIRIYSHNRNNGTLPLIQRASDRLEELTGSPLPVVGQLTRQSSRAWNARKPAIVWEVKENVRAGDPPQKVHPIFRQVLDTRFRHSTVIYTDGSKCEDTVGAAFYNVGIAQKYSLPKECSVFSAEAYAIKMALSVPNVRNEVVIMTDSASCLLALEAGHSRHPWIQEIEQIVQNKSVRFCWIPGHTGISGNTEADRLANEGKTQPVTNIPIPAEDAARAAKQAIRLRWERQWFEARDVKLREVKRDTLRWTDRGSPAEQRQLTRLRIGHTRLTHTFLLKKEEPPNCECCDVELTVRHIILECRKYDGERRKYNIGSSLYEALGNTDEQAIQLLNFLRETKLNNKL
ncbi:uncharacterized protein LOC131428855 [Malaya genurostris]|uniref:uncharacterized protein LOC131428855 n=1 Tax=Malaya genurostris TaxID=325434 RepID=UPI0026F38D2F|nr:uncharacterized protein LOC131428855 [Malaya genurostris]